MNITIYTLFFIFIFIKFSISTGDVVAPAYTAVDFILLDCGASSNSNDTSGRNWHGDVGSTYAAVSNASTESLPFPASYMHPSVFQVPYRNARVSRSRFSYNFPVGAGPKFVRLHFYPDAYSDFETSESFFSVTANDFTLLANFSAFLHSRNLSKPSFMKEFVVNVRENQGLDLTFSPNPGSFAFINGIEIVSMPDTLYFRGDDVAIKFVNEIYYLQNDTALENLYRLNVGGGGGVDIRDDSGPERGMFRAWSPDDDFIFGADFSYTPHRVDLPIRYTSQTPPHSAPPIVYQTMRSMANFSRSLEWTFPVDSGFYYLVRLHFCDILQEITKQFEMVFTIFINNKIVEIEADIIFWTVSNQTAIFKDYITWVADDGHGGKQDLPLSLKPVDDQTKYKDAMLNGLEIFKLSDRKRSLAAANPEAAMDSSPPTGLVSPGRKKRSVGSSLIYASFIGVLALVAVMSFLIFWRRFNKLESSSSTGSRESDISLPSELCRYFSIDEIKTATRNFHDDFIIGRGGFGNVYKGLINDPAAATVAIKRLNPSSKQGAREFFTEIEMLSKLRHLHLVSLIGYCDDDGEMILVYEYMPNGTLRDHLHSSENSPLTWKQRLQICVGAAKGLDYLHIGAKHTIIHRDVKSANILLDEKWVAKVSDFGISKVGPAAGLDTHVSTVVKGSFGYMDPEYYRMQQLTNKSDVYSFGVVLLEVLCGRPAVNQSLPTEEMNLAEWTKFCFRKGTPEQIIDSNLKGKMAPECLSKFVETAVACLGNRGVDRPSMNNVVWSLEFAMQLQESAESTKANDADDGFMGMSPSLLPLLGIGAFDTAEDEASFLRSSELAAAKSSDFSTGSHGWTQSLNSVWSSNRSVDNLQEDGIHGV